jgi:hypothetical protein
VNCTCIPAVLVAARLVQLLKKLQVPDRKVHPRQAGPYIQDSIKERKFSQTGGFMKKEIQNDQGRYENLVAMSLYKAVQ